MSCEGRREAAAGEVSIEELPDLDLEKILQKHYEAWGGEDVLRGIKTLMAYGQIHFKDNSFPFALFKKSPGKVRITLEYPHGRLITGYDGQTIWQRAVSDSGDEEMSYVEDETAAGFIRDASITTFLFDYEQKGAGLELLDKAEAAGRPCYVILAQVPGQEKITYYIDGETFLLAKRDTREFINGQWGAFETFYSDYRPVENLKVPHQTEDHFKGGFYSKTVVEEARVNASIMDAVFAAPEL